jgi:hypothetical protein
MKRFFLIILLFSLFSCAPAPDLHPTNIPFATTALQTITPTVTATLPQATKTKEFINIVQREADPAEWKQFYGKDMVVKIGLDRKQRMWIALSGGEIGFFDGSKWVLFSGKDYGLPGKPFDMAIAPDGSVWLAGRHALSRYQNGHWDVFPMPGVTETAFPRLAIDSSGVVWVTTPLCYCGNSINKFDGKNWSYIMLWTTESTLDVQQLLFTPDGALWAPDDGGTLGRYAGKAWKSYSTTELWSTDYYGFGMRIASDQHGNIFGIYTGNSWIAQIDRSGHVSKIPYSTKLQLNETRLRLFVDRQDTIWVNACLKDKPNACLAYYKDNQWVSFIDLPFEAVADINELADETLLVATTRGLFQYKPAK